MLFLEWGLFTLFREGELEFFGYRIFRKYKGVVTLFWSLLQNFTKINENLQYLVKIIILSIFFSFRYKIGKKLVFVRFC